MRFSSVGFALSVGMMLMVVLFGFTLLSAAGLTGFAADDALTEHRQPTGPGERKGPQASPPLAVALTPARTSAQTAEIAAGDALFKGNCAQCHAVNEQVVGPALAGIGQRRPMSWILPWVKNPSKLVASGDDYAVALFTKYSKQQMPSFALSDREIASIVAYINASAAPAVATAATVTVAVR